MTGITGTLRLVLPGCLFVFGLTAAAQNTDSNIVPGRHDGLADGTSGDHSTLPVSQTETSAADSVTAQQHQSAESQDSLAQPSDPKPETDTFPLWTDVRNAISWPEVVIGFLVLILAVVAFRHYVLEPRRRRKPLLEAIKIVSLNNQDRFEEAERLLSQALTSGLSTSDIAEARFALAYIRAQLGHYSAAETSLAELKEVQELTPEAAYLEMWTATRQSDFERVESLFLESPQRAELEDLLQTRLMVSIAYVKRARRHWDKKQVASAAQYFQRIRELGELTEFIPVHIEDHQLLLGIQELSEENFQDAQENFRNAAESSSGSQLTQLMGKLGLVLCDWVRESETRAELDGPLGELAESFLEFIDSRDDELAKSECPQCRKTHVVRADDHERRVVCPRCTQFFVVEKISPWNADTETEATQGEQDQSDDGDDGSDSNGDDSTSDEKVEQSSKQPAPLMNEDDLLVRDVLIWRMVSLLSCWMTLPEKEPLAESELEQLRLRAADVYKIDEHSGHAALIEGLISYYFSFDSDEQRKAGADLIAKAVSDGNVNLTEVHSLLDGETRRAERRAQAAKQLIDYIGRYLSDPQVPKDVRRRVQKSLRSYADRFEQEFDTAEMEDSRFDNAPTARDMGARLEGIDSRLAQFLKNSPELSDSERESIRDKKKAMDDAGNALREGARQFEESEGDVVSVVGQILLNEEEETPDK